MRLLRGLFVCSLLIASAGTAAADAVARMDMEKLRAAHEKVESLKKQLRKVSLPSGYDDVRTLLHVHSAFSHDSRGKIEDIVAAAKQVGVRVILFNEHPASHYDYINDGHHGMKDGVLLIPGAESGGFLAYPKRSIQDQKPEGNQAFSDLVRSTDGLIFLCHLEERMSWEIAGLTGSEIYNTHADFKDEPKLLKKLMTPQGMLDLVPALKQYPQEVFGALLDYPADYLKRYDELCQKFHHTGVSANDAHHNQAFRGTLTAEGKVQVEDALGKRLAIFTPEKLPELKALVENKKPGDVVFELDMDPYARSFHHVSTHLLMKTVDEASVWETLKAGRAYVAFDWIADPTGFVLRADRGDETWPMGSDVKLAPGLKLRAEAPLEGQFKLVRNGEPVLEKTANAIEFEVDKPGNYRVEVWQTLAGEARPWILSNPIYVQAD